MTISYFQPVAVVFIKDRTINFGDFPSGNYSLGSFITGDTAGFHPDVATALIAAGVARLYVPSVVVPPPKTHLFIAFRVDHTILFGDSPFYAGVYQAGDYGNFETMFANSLIAAGIATVVAMTQVFFLQRYVVATKDTSYNLGTYNYGDSVSLESSYANQLLAAGVVTTSPAAFYQYPIYDDSAPVQRFLIAAGVVPP